MKPIIIACILAVNLALTLEADLSPWKDLRGNLENNIGYMHHHGVIISRNTDAAIYWYERAIKNDNAVAANNLAELYETSDAYQVSDRELLFLYRIAAEDGIDTAQNNLGVLLLKMNDSESVLWFERASRSRDVSVSTTATENLRTAKSKFD
jgi:TPR repeat protein